MNFVLFGILCYVLIQFAIGAYVGRRIKNEKDYLLAGKSLGIPLATFSIFATWFGAETCIGSAGRIFENGLSGGRADPFGYTLCLLMVGLFFASALWKKNLTTLADLYRNRYSVGVERLAVALMIPTSIMWAAAQIRAFGEVLSASSSGLSVDMAITIAAALVIAYTVMGGLLADTITDFVQGIALIAGLLVLFATVVGALGGPIEALQTIDVKRLNPFPATDENPWARLDAWMIPILGSIVAQELISRVLASRSADVARKSALLASGIYLIVGSIPVMIGLLAPALLQSPEGSDQVLPLLAKTYLSPFLYVLFAGALVSAILSTVDSTLLASAALFSHNLVLPAMKRPSEKMKVRMARYSVAASGVLAYILAFYADGIFALVELASSWGGSGLLTITVFGLFGHFGGRLAAYGALVVGIPVLHWAQTIGQVPAPFLFSTAVSMGVYVVMGVVEKAAWPRGVWIRIASLRRIRAS